MNSLHQWGRKSTLFSLKKKALAVEFKLHITNGIPLLQSPSQQGVKTSSINALKNQKNY